MQLFEGNGYCRSAALLVVVSAPLFALGKPIESSVDVAQASTVTYKVIAYTSGDCSDGEYYSMGSRGYGSASDNFPQNQLPTSIQLIPGVGCTITVFRSPGQTGASYTFSEEICAGNGNFGGQSVASWSRSC